MKKQVGFTLIELLIVIVIIGILAAFAVPKWAEIEKKARESVVTAFAGSVSSTAGMVKAMFNLNGLANLTQVDIGGGVLVTVNTTTGFPTMLGIQEAMSPGATEGFTIAGTVFQKNGAPGGGTNCSVTYTDTTGETTVDVTNC